MAALKGQPAPKPGSLTAPVPGKEEQLTAASLLEDAPTPSMQGADALLADAGEVQSAPQEIPPEQFAPQPGAIQANVEQFNPDALVTRIQAGLAANDTEKMNFLKKKYGEQNVAMKDGDIYYRKDPKEKLRPLDPATFELISDILPDFAREIVTETAMVPGELVGGLIGAGAGTPVAPGIGSIAGAATGITAGRVASVPGANSIADRVAAAAGVPQDESRSRGLENVVGMGVEATMPFVGRKVGQMIAKRIPGTAAYAAAREAGEKEVVALSKQSREVLAAADALEKEGTNLNLMQHQLHPDAPQIEKKVLEAEMLPAFRQKQQEFAEGYGSALEKNIQEIARRANPDGRVAPANLASTITNAVESLDRAEAQAIGSFRAKAMAKLGNSKQQLPPEMSDEILGIMKELGFQPKRQRLQSVTRAGSVPSLMARGAGQTPNVVERTQWVPPDAKTMQNIVGRLGLDEGQTRSVVNVLNEYGQLISRGNEARLSDVERLIKRMGPLNQKLRGSAISGTWGRLTGNLRNFRREVIGNALEDDFERTAFNKAMDDFSMIRSNTDQLSDVLRGDITAKSVVNGFFKGKENLANIRALKKITGADSPQWGALKEEFLNQLMLKHSGTGPTGFNSKAFLNDLEKNYGDDFMREVINDGKAGPNLQSVKNLLTVGQRIEASQRGLKIDQLSQKRADAAAEGLFGYVKASPFRMLNSLKKLAGLAGDRESVLMEILNRDGIEQYLNKHKTSSREKLALQNKLETLLVDYNAARQAARILEVGKDVTKQVGKSAVRESVVRRTAR